LQRETRFGNLETIPKKRGGEKKTKVGGRKEYGLAALGKKKRANEKKGMKKNADVKCKKEQA